MSRTFAGMRALSSALMAAALVCTFARTPEASAASPYDAQWVGYPLPNIQGSLSAMTPWAGGLAAGGGLFYFGTTTASRVALWDGVSWQALGTGGPVAGVMALTTRGGQLIATSAGGSGSAPGVGEKPAIYAWDGASWTTIGSANGNVTCAAVLGTDLYVGGTFLSINGVAASKVARWDGSSWTAVAGGFSSTSSLKSLVVYGPSLKLIAAGTLPAYQGVAQFDGFTWTQVGAGLQNGAVAAVVNALAADGQMLYASGNFNLSGGVGVTKTALWNGSTWTPLVGATTASDALAIYGAQPMATVLDAGFNRPQLWSGSVWQPFNHPNVIPLAYAQVGGTLFAAGNLSGGIVGTTPAVINAFQSFDGSAWAPVQQAWAPGMKGLAGNAYCAQEYHGSLFVGGTFGYAGAGTNYLFSPGVAQWNGTDWIAIGAGNQHFDLDVWSDSLVAAADQFVKVWNGSSWRKLQTGSNQFGLFVDGIAVHQGNLYAFGPPTYGATTLNGIGRWDGTTWQPVGNGFDAGAGNPTVGTTYGGQLVVGGLFANASGVPVRNIASWDGSAYHALAGGVDSWVIALLVDGADLIVGGSFSEVNGDTMRGVARWDGAQWHAMGTRARAVGALRSHSGRIYASGSFVGDDDLVAWGVAVWTGADWQLLNSSLDAFGTANGIEFLGDDLYLVGSFNAVGGHAARGFARLPNVSTLGVAPGGPRGAALAVSPWPNPSRGRVQLSVTMPTSGRARLVLHDVAGREVARLLDGEHAAGQFDLAWDSRVSPGLYFATLEAAGQRRTTRLVRLK